METTISLAKEHGLAALTLFAVQYVSVRSYNLRGQIAENHQSIRADISALGERVARVETRVGGFEERLERDLPPDDLFWRCSLKSKTPGRGRGFWLGAAKPPGWLGRDE